MPDASYNTRLRTNAQILPPRRLRQSPCPPFRRPRPLKHRPQQSSPAPLTFPPPNALINEDDATNKTFLAIGRALSSIQNRAITIKDLSHLVREYGLSCQNVSAASQAITTFIRQHLQRCREDGSPPLLLSVVLTGIREYDDPLAPALHSRSGGTSSQVKDTTETLTKFRKGTTVWFLSPAVGAPCPFAREGISVDDITATTPHGTKRKRDSQVNNSPRKMPTRHRRESCEDLSVPSHPRIRLTLRIRPPEPQSDTDPDSSSESGNESTDSDSDIGAERPRYSETGSDISDDSGSEANSSMDLDDTGRVSSEELSGYPYTPCIPTPHYSTPLTSVASSTDPCGPLSPYLKSNLCSSHFIKSTFSSFRASWSNLPDDRAASLPFSAASPPDSEDEDEDYHNSMVGMRRDSRSLTLKEEDEDEQNVLMFEPIVPKYVPGGVHYIKPPSSEVSDSPDWSSPKQEASPETVSTPLETLPGFLPLVEPISSQISIKEESASALLPSHTCVNVKIEDVDNDSQGPADCSLTGVDDVEVLGPESVRIREWDAAWNAAGHIVNIDETPPSPPPSDHQSDSTPISLLTSPVSQTSVPLNYEYISIDRTVIDNVPVYRAFLAPGLPLLRRVDNSHINVNPLITFLNISLAALFVHVAAPRMTVSFADGPLGGTWVPLSVADAVMYPFDAKLPPKLRETYLVSDLEKLYFVKEVNRPGDEDSLLANASLSHGDEETLGIDASIRVEDLFEGDYGHSHRHSSSTHELWWETQRSSTYFSISAVRASAGSPVETLNEQEERIFYSLVDLLEPAASQQQQQQSSESNMSPPKLCTSILSDSCSPLSSPPSSPVLLSRSNSTQDKENTSVSKRSLPRRKHGKTEAVPLRRSTRMSSKQPTGPTTRFRSRKT